MKYKPTEWVDHVNSGNKYTLINNADGTTNIDYAGKVIQQGTPMSAENFNHMEQGIAEAFQAVNSAMDKIKEFVNLLDNKVDKIEGKGLSANDYTTAEKTKLSGIEAGAQKNSITGVKGNAETSYRTGNVNITPANIGAAASSHTHNYAGSSNAGGAANSATKLATARTINGVSFDGSANIALPSGRTWNCGGEAGMTKGWYHFLTKTMYKNEDFNMTLSVQDTYSIFNRYGIFHIHVRRNQETVCPTPHRFGWVIRSGWNEDSVAAVISGTEIKLYIYSNADDYNHISFSVLHQSNRTNAEISNLTLVEILNAIDTVTPDIISADIGTVLTSKSASTVSAAQTSLFNANSLNSSTVTVEIENLFTDYKAVVCNINGDSKSSSVLPLSHIKSCTSIPYYGNGCNHYFRYIDNNTMMIYTGFAQSNPKISSVEIISLY